jgi:protein TonB
MSARTDILDQPERLRGAFMSSLVLHLCMLGLFVSATVGHFLGRDVVQLGDPKGGGFGSVAVNAVATIPLYNRPAPPNPVAKDTPNLVPQTVTKPKPQPKPAVKAPDPDAIPLRSKNAKTRPTPQAATPNPYAERHPPAPNQLTSSMGAAASSPVYAVSGAGQVGVGNNSPFGTMLGYYATLLRDLVARNWRTGDVDARLQTAPPVTVAFTLLRDGTVPPGSVKVVQSSGNRALDFSAMRAILDAGKFPPIPPQYTKDRADCELTFELRR